MKRFLALPLIFAIVAAAPPKVEVADGDWSWLPMLESRGYDHLDPKLMARLWEIAQQHQCKLPGYSGGKLDLRLSFAAQYNPDGSLARVILPRMNCTEAEGIIAGAVLEMMKAGDYRPTGQNPDGWYRGNFAFGYEAPA
jgi:hypothetical protein